MKTMYKGRGKKTITILLTFLFLFFPLGNLQAVGLSARLSGRILLQVEGQGEAYYVNPSDLKRYYLGRPDDAFVVMRSFGLGATNVDIDNFLKNGARANLSGRILLRVQDQGQAYYVNPLNLRLYYLGRPADAFAVMRQLGLGIKNSDLNLITVGKVESNTPSPDQTSGQKIGDGEKLVVFNWKYKNKQYSLEQVFSDDLYQSYKNSDKNYYYPSNNPPQNPREEYYNIFLKLKKGDDSIDKLISSLRSVAIQDRLSDDEFVEFAMAFVQHLSYDFSKKETDPQNFPYETLYTATGVCSDFTFLAVLMLRKLGYGAAIFDFPNVKHSSAAVLCSGGVHNSGYCFIETTNYFPIGVFPPGIASGQADSSGINWEYLFTDSSLGKLEIQQATKGKAYSGFPSSVARVEAIKKMQKGIKSKEPDLKFLQNQLNSLKEQINQTLSQAEKYKQANNWNNYNQKIEEYNLQADEYNAILANFNIKLDIYNLDNQLLQKEIKDFFQN